VDKIDAIRVSVIMPLYNGASTVAESIHSVQNQTLVDWELIVVDDRSADSGAGIVNEIAAMDHRIKLVRLSENSGAGNARNVAIDLAQGRYIAFLDADDLWDTGKLSDQISFMESYGSVFTFGAYRLIDGEGRFLGTFMPHKASVTYSDLLRTCSIGTLTVMYDSQAIGKFRFDEIRRTQDYLLWLKILKTGIKAQLVPGILASYRVLNGSLSRNKFAKARMQWRIYRLHERLPILWAVYFMLHYSLNGLGKNLLPSIRRALLIRSLSRNQKL